MSTIDPGRDLTPGSSPELVQSHVNLWADPVLPILPDKSETPLGEGLRHRGILRIPERGATLAFTIPAAAGASLVLPISTIGALQTGILTNVYMQISNALGTAGEVVTLLLQNTFGEIYLGSTIQLTAVAFGGILWKFDNLYMPFRNGLVMSSLNGPQGAGNQGQLSLNLIWHQ
jgi:hypothetical protein